LQLVKHSIVLLAVIAIALSFALGTPAPAPNAVATPTSHLPATQPGSGPDEGVFLVTTADDGSRVTYFIAGNARHSILAADMQVELQLNPLWPVRTVSPDDVLSFPEGAPVGTARVGLVGGAVAESAADTAAQEANPPAASDVAEEAPAPVAADDEQPQADTAADQEATTYTVKRGDSAFLIGRRFGVSQHDLLAANGIANPNRVYVGQVLSIPAS
jgi:LysM repeat protein